MEISRNAIILIHILIQVAKCGNFLVFIKECIISHSGKPFYMVLLKTDVPRPKLALA